MIVKSTSNQVENSSSASSSEKGEVHPKFRPDIEGLRAIAILLVVGYHLGIPGFSGGYIGVDIFFVLSGYLITWLLVQEAEKTGSIDLFRFYSRRARRLLPAFGVVLFATIILGTIIFAPFEQHKLANTSIATTLYMSNFFFIRGATDYLGATADANPLLHTWSLSVEEQFYIVWPFFIMFGVGALKWQRRKPNRRRLLLWMTAIASISFLLSLYLTYTRQPWAFFLSPARAWEFAIGAIAMLAPQGSWLVVIPHNLKKQQSYPINSGFLNKPVNLLGWTGLCGILIAAATFDKTTIFPGLAALLPAISTVVVLRAGAANILTGIAKTLSLRPLQKIGRLSYSWYLWHWPVLVFATAVNPALSLPIRLCLVAASLVMAEVSYRFIENPIRYHRILSRSSAYSLVMAAFITVFGIVLSFAWRQMSIRWAELPEQIRFTHANDDIPSVYSSGCHADFYMVDVNVDKCSSGSDSAPGTLILFGDSHAAQWYPALEQMTKQYGWRLISMTKSACVPVELPLFDSKIGREYSECTVWRNAALQTIQKLSPDLVVISFSDHYLFSDKDWFTGFDKVLKSLSKSSRYVVILRDTHKLNVDPPTWLARSKWRPDFLSRISSEQNVTARKSSQKIFDIQQQVAGHYDNVFIIDMMPEIFPNASCDLERDGLIVYRDSGHLSATFSTSMTQALTNHIENLLNFQQHQAHSQFQ